MNSPMNSCMGGVWPARGRGCRRLVAGPATDWDSGGQLGAGPTGGRDTGVWLAGSALIGLVGQLQCMTMTSRLAFIYIDECGILSKSFSALIKMII